MIRTLCFLILVSFATSTAIAQPSPVLDKQVLLDRQTFWDNRDWDWYRANIPFLETPDADIDTTYYYRWELVTKHVVYGSPRSGYSFTEFIDRPFWSGAYGAISCPAGHQLYEVRWLHDERYAKDYARYWLRTPGAQPRNYSTWLADSVWAIRLARGDVAFATDLLADLKKNYEGWEKRHFVAEVGLFWQTGHDDGMEFNILSRQTKDILRGAPSYRPSFNAYMYADAVAIASIARAANDEATAKQYEAKAASIKKLVQEKLWDPTRQFFFPMLRNDEEKDGHTMKALTLTHQTGKFAGSKHGRELIGYVPWQFNLPDKDKGFEAAWKFLMDRDYFAADFGPTVTERHDPLFLVTDHCCWWSGQSWPYATTQTLVAFANLLNNYEQKAVTRDDYFKVLKTYTMTHRKDGKPYIAEGANPDTGSWKGYDGYNHSEHYFHSGYNDLIITGLIGLRPREDDTIEVNPLAPAAWDYFALVDVPYQGRLVSVIWDRTGEKYQQGAGLHVIVDGKKIAGATKIERLTAKLPPLSAEQVRKPAPVYNFAVNNEGRFYPRVTVSHAGERSSAQNAVDGNYWYHLHPPNRWTTEGSGNASDWFEVDLGTARTLHEIKLFLLDDGDKIKAPAAIKLEASDGGTGGSSTWKEIEGVKVHPATPTGRRPNTYTFAPQPIRRMRATFTHQKGAASGLTEFEAWGTSDGPLTDPPAPPPSLAYNATGKGFPQVTASHTSRFDKLEFVQDGIISYRHSPNNRWTSYESPNASDWLQIEFAEAKTVGRIELYIYDDRGGVQAPAAYTVEHFDGAGWKEAANLRRSPAKPRGNAMNTVTFDPVKANKVRVVFTHAGKARSGLTEIEVWEK